MKRKRMITDVILTVLLFWLMAFEMIGGRAHEWAGTGMFAAFILHHIWNRKWISSLFKGKYTSLRIFQTVLVILILLSMVTSMVSGIIVSRYVFRFLPVEGGMGAARICHMLAAYWGFVFMSLHLGIHWQMMLRPGRKQSGRYSGKIPVMGIIGAAIAAYGVYAFIKRDFVDYMFVRSSFVFFDYSEPLALFYIDYVAIMGLFVWIGHYLSILCRKKKQVLIAENDRESGVTE